MAVVLRNRNQAMTMMEILIVIALIAVLAALGITNLGGILGRSKESLAKSFLDGPMLAAVTAEWQINGKFDNNSPGSIKKTFSTPPKDPWGEEWEIGNPVDNLITVKSKANGNIKCKYKGEANCVTIVESDASQPALSK